MDEDLLQVCYNVDLYFGPRPSSIGPVALLPSYEDNRPDSVLRFNDPTGIFALFLEVRTSLSIRPYNPAANPNDEPDPLCNFRELGEPQADDTPFGQINISFFVTELEPHVDEVLSDSDKRIRDRLRRIFPDYPSPSANRICRLTLMTELVHEHIPVDLVTISNGDLDTIAHQTGHLLHHSGGADFLPRVKNALTRLWARSTGNKKLGGAGDERLGRLRNCLDQLEDTQYWDSVFGALVELQALLDVRDSSLSPTSEVSLSSNPFTESTPSPSSQSL
ncbi:hypothetical protein PGQ11_009916 [Apiospora arundinis]|uniref:Uncharacterized protein n=1 Tax=Apiospora arundinis TaxID=335852 RepID=A0ABR2I984_9PEZI